MIKRKILVVTSIVLSVFVLLSAVGCSSPKTKESSEKVVSSALENFKKGDIAGFYSQFNLAKGAKTKDSAKDLEFEAKLIGPKTSFKVVSSKDNEKAGTAKVEVEITRPDLVAVFAKTKELALLEAGAVANMSADEAKTRSKELFAQALGETTATKTIKVSVDLVRVKNADGTYQWKISNNTLYAPLFGNDADFVAK